MYITNVSDYDNMTDEYDDSLSINNTCTINESNIDIFIPAFLLTIPCGVSIVCSMSLMVYTLIKPLL